MPKQLEWTPERVRKFWNAVSGSAIDQHAFGRVAGRQLLELVAPHLPSATRVADFGAGRGHFTSHLLESGYHVGMYEPSADNFLPEIRAHPNAHWVDPENIGEPYDIVFCLETIEHVLQVEEQEFFDRLKRLVKPGGYLVMSTPHNENLELAQVYCVESDTFFHPWQHVRSFTARKLTDLLAGYGFQKRVIMAGDFSWNINLYNQLEAKDRQLADFYPLLRRLVGAESEGGGEASKVRETVEAVWAIHWEHVKTEINGLIQPISNHVAEMLRVLRTATAKDYDANTRLRDAMQQLLNEANESMRRLWLPETEMQPKALAALEPSLRGLSNYIQVIGAELSKLADREDSLASVASHRSLEERAAALAALSEELQWEVTGIAEALRSARATLTFAPSAEMPSQAGDANSAIGLSVSELDAEALTELIDAAYARLARVRPASDRRHAQGGDLDCTYGAGQTLVFVGQMN